MEWSRIASQHFTAVHMGWDVFLHYSPFEECWTISLIPPGRWSQSICLFLFDEILLEEGAKERADFEVLEALGR